jgi:hypothetical protein
MEPGLPAGKAGDEVFGITNLILFPKTLVEHVIQ